MRTVSSHSAEKDLTDKVRVPSSVGVLDHPKYRQLLKTLSYFHIKGHKKFDSSWENQFGQPCWKGTVGILHLCRVVLFPPGMSSCTTANNVGIRRL